MPANAPDPNEGEAGRGGEDPEVRERIMAATLVAAGELGYRRLTVAAVLERYGGYRQQFYRYFANGGDAYDTAYATHVQRLQARLLTAAATAEGWRVGLRAGLRELARFAEEDPALASGLLLQVHVAGKPALGQRQEVLERLSRAVDSARRETRSRHSPPPLTAPVMVSAIESAVVRALAKGEPERFERAIPELEQLVCKLYFG